ncbi:hypothetical protein [Methanolapillus ohkumae]|uniref:hypothetical protein n=1 Tax=Methanolapillus ohkumae TaxID=3028298 RepID=UPI0030B8CAC7
MTPSLKIKETTQSIIIPIHVNTSENSDAYQRPNSSEKYLFLKKDRNGEMQQQTVILKVANYSTGAAIL